MIEADERPDKTFVLGLQYHPEISVVRENDEASLVYFQAIVDMADKARSYALVPQHEMMATLYDLTFARVFTI